MTQVLCSCNLSAIPAKFSQLKWRIRAMRIIIKNLYTCPKCGHSVGWRRRWLKSGIFTQWLCKNCGTTLEYDCWKSLVLIPMFVLLIYAWIKPQVHVVAVYFFVFLSFLGIYFAKTFINPIVESKNMKKISACPNCGHLTDWRRRLNTPLFYQWPCENCGTQLGFSYWQSLILIPLIAILLYLWIEPQRTILFSFTVGTFLVIHLARIFVIPIVEKGARQKSDSD